MPNIRLKRSAVSGNVPTTDQLELGEIALNTYDGKAFIKKSVNGNESVVELGGSTSVSASHANSADTATYATTAGTATNATNATNAVSSSYALSSSFASTASYFSGSIPNAITASYALTASYVNTLSQSLTVIGNLTVVGTQSVSYITSSIVNVGSNIITVNSNTPTVRFGGLSVFDSGSTGLTGSLFWDSLQNNWVYSNPSGSTYDGAMVLAGPKNTSGLGNEQGITTNALTKGQGGDHITSSLITEDGTNFRVPFNTIITGSVQANSFTGSIQGTATTASYVQNAQTASYVLQAVSASYWSGSIINAATASYVQTAQTASYVLQAISASYWSGSITNAATASYVQTAQTASYVVTANTASYVVTAQTASYWSGSITNAATASYVQNAQTASFVTLAQTASYVQTTQTASYVTTAQTASYVLLAVSASYHSGSGIISNAITASYVTTAQTASYVLQAVSASYATTASYVANASSFPYTGSAIISGSLSVTGSGSFIGNVGINTPDPSVAFEVNGSARITGSAVAQQYFQQLGASVTNRASLVIQPNEFDNSSTANTSSFGIVSSVINKSSNSGGVITWGGIFYSRPYGTSTGYIAGYGLGSYALRNNALDTSTNASNTLIGLITNVGHQTSLNGAATTATVTGVQNTIQSQTGSITNAYGQTTALGVATSANLTSTVTNFYGLSTSATVGATSGTGTGTLTNYYDLYLQGATIQTTGIVTNKWGVYQLNSAHANYFAGNIGIGTTTPNTKLDVNGNVLVTGSVTATLGFTGSLQGTATTASFVTTAQTASYVLNAVSASYASTAGSTSAVAGGTTNYIPLWTSSTTLSSSAVYQSSGNIGIGTTSPGANLVVQNSSGTSIPSLGASGGHFQLQNGTYGLLAGVNGAGNAWMQVQRTDSTATAYNLLLQPSGGNVGIGLTSPDGGAKLDVSGVIRSIVSGGTAQLLLNNGSTQLSVDNNSGNMIFRAPAGSEGFRMSSAGNILMGTSTDSGYKLDVSGTGRFTGAIFGNQGLSVSGYGGISNSANKFVLDFYNGNSRFYSLGTNTTTKGGFEFHTNSSDGSLDVIALKIDASSNVGIGTTSPSYLLDVNGTGRFSGNLISNAQLQANSTAGATNGILLSAISGYASSINFSRSGYNNWYIGSPSNSTSLVIGGNADMSTSAFFTLASSGAATFSNNVTISTSVIIGDDTTYGSPYKVVAFGGNSNGYNRIFGATGTTDGLYFAASTGRGFFFRPNGGTSDLVYITSTGILYSTVDTRSPVYYDSNNTSYYVDPAGTSNLSRVDADSQMRAPIYYDSANTTYYLDPNSTGVSLYVAGDIQLGTGGTNTGLRIDNGAGTGDYSRIRFYQAGTNNQTIHVFSSNWQSSTLLASSAGAININGANGVTLGVWNSPSVVADNSGNFYTKIFYDLDNTAYYINPNSNSISYTSQFYGIGDINWYRITNPGGAAYTTGTSSITGAWKIKLPTAKNNSSTMMRMTVKIYQYTTGASHTFEIGGYNYSGGNWYNLFATNSTDSGNNYTIRFGYDSTSDCIWIGETTSTWSYPQVFVTEWQGGYGGQGAGWADGWSITPVTAFDVVEQSRSPALIVTQNNTSALYGSIFYDSDNTSYYLDPTSTSYSSYNLGGARFRNIEISNATYNDTIQNVTSGGNIWINYGHNGNVGLAYGGGYTTAYQSIRSPIFYDSADTAYYVDPNGTSVVNSFYATQNYANGGWFRNTAANTGLYNESSTQHWSSTTNGWWDASSTTSFSGIRMYTGGHVTTLRGSFYADNNNYIGILANDQNWALRADSSKNVQVYGDITVGNSTNSNIYMTDTDETTRRIHCNSGRVGFLNTSNAWGAYCDNSGNWTTDFIGYAGGSFRAPVFYDNNDTGYYLDPNSTSDLALRIRGGALHGPNATWGAYLLVGGDGRQNYINNTAVASVSTTNGNLHLDGASGFNTYINWYDGDNIYIGAGDSSTENGRFYNSGYLQMRSSVRAPLFYDSDNTGYYVDPASTSVLNGINIAGSYKRSAAGAGYLDGNYSSVETTSTTGPIYTIGGSYAPTSTSLNNMYGVGYSYNNFTGAFGPANTWGFYVADNGTSNIFLSSGGVGYYRTSVQAPIFYDYNNTAYYVDPAGSSRMGAIDSDQLQSLGQAYFRDNINMLNSAGSGWITLVSRNSGSPLFYGSVYYDQDNTGYYCDPASTTRLYTFTTDNTITSGNYIRINANSNLYLDYNYGQSVVGVYSSYRFQGVFAMGDSYKLSIDGTTPGNLYGLSWSHPNAGGQASYLSSHGLLVMVNGYTYAALSDVIYAATSMKAPIYYDSGNTGYYIDPASTSYINILGTAGRIQGGGFIDSADITGGSFRIYDGSTFRGGFGTSRWADGTSATNQMCVYSVGDGINFYTNSSTTVRVLINSSGLTIYGTLTETSSERYKENIYTLDNALDKVTSLRGVSYNKKGNTQQEIGVIAEEVADVLPEVLKYNSDGEPDSVAYGRLSAVFIEAIKELKQEIKELQNEIKTLKQQ